MAHSGRVSSPTTRGRGPTFSVALAIHRLSPWGGLERDALRVAREAVGRGHRVAVLSGEVAEGLDLSDLDVVRLEPRGRTNHARARAFSSEVAARASDYDARIGFNASAGLDLFFAGDRCYRDRVHESRGPWVRLTPRHRTLAALEAEVLCGTRGPRILLLAEAHRAVFQRWYGTPDDRFEVLPPGIDPSRRRGPNHAEDRRRIRAEFGVPENARLILFLGSDFRRKGADRALAALARLPDAPHHHLVVAGAGDARWIERAARALGLVVGPAPGARVHLAGPRDDAGALLAASDALVHLARSEAGGAVLLEALSAGVPVVATDVCGYAPWVAASGAGAVLRANVDAPDAARALVRVLSDHEMPDRALSFVDAHPELFTMHARIVDALERAAEERRGR